MKKSELFFTFVLIPVDILMVASSFIIAYYLRFGLDSNGILSTIPIYQYINFSFTIIPIWIVIFVLNGLYNINLDRGLFNISRKVFVSNSVAILFLALGIFFAKTMFFSRLILIFIWLLSIILIMLGRIVIKIIRLNLMQFGIGRRNVLLVGDNLVSEFVAFEIKKNRGLGLKIIGVINGDHANRGNLKQVGTLKDIGAVVKKYKIDEIILADAKLSRTKTAELIQFCTNSNLTFKFIPDILALISSNTIASTIGSMPVLELKTIALDGWGRIVKRIFDIVGSMILIIVFSPVFLITAIGVKISSPNGPVLFLQKRVGRAGTFNFLKFRTMKPDAHKQHRRYIKKYGNMFKLKDDPRIYPLGKFLRKYSIDELPQFFNVLRGEMSLIGPRPPMQEEVLHYNEWQNRRLGIKPGITGLWQVSGRSNVDFDEWVRLDIYYIENWSMWLDIVILFKTVGAVFRGRGAY